MFFLHSYGSFIASTLLLRKVMLRVDERSRLYADALQIYSGPTESTKTDKIVVFGRWNRKTWLPATCVAASWRCNTSTVNICVWHKHQCMAEKRPSSHIATTSMHEISALLQQSGHHPHEPCHQAYRCAAAQMSELPWLFWKHLGRTFHERAVDF